MSSWYYYLCFMMIERGGGGNQNTQQDQSFHNYYYGKICFTCVIFEFLFPGHIFNFTFPLLSLFPFPLLLLLHLIPPLFCLLAYHLVA
ncbi:hypothetical protein FB192DRAFT_1349756 [Mucor lusitanicus]|uniref:Uncharacterized protein n=1 Tax=Mucor circinelloides f. lusitanicus TaxID=29924 RepID=A0A8H4BPQ8_MUCCL|nr:hypothetical protein FB192DRAFT_1349756 [Mucor lusitanicus]